MTTATRTPAGTQFGVERPWAEPSRQLAYRLASDLETGLTTAEAARRLEAAGRNELAEAERLPWWALLARQFANTMILVLAAAAVVTLAIGDRTDTL